MPLSKRTKKASAQWASVYRHLFELEQMISNLQREGDGNKVLDAFYTMEDTIRRTYKESENYIPKKHVDGVQRMEEVDRGAKMGPAMIAKQEAWEVLLVCWPI